MSTDTLSNLVAKYKDRLENMQRLSAAALSAKVITRTPVLTGSLRASWTPNNGSPIANNVNIGGGGNSRAAVTAVVNSLKAGDTYSLANGQPYARRIEYEGWSAKAPGGMVRVSVAEWQSVVNEAVARSGS